MNVVTKVELYGLTRYTTANDRAAVAFPTHFDCLSHVNFNFNSKICDPNIELP